MDLPLYFRVIARFRYLVLFGLALAVVLTLGTIFRVNVGGGQPWIEFRQKPTWKATETLILTQHGFSLGRTNSSSDFSPLAVLYAQLTNSDVVRSRVLGNSPPEGDDYQASAVVDPSQGGALPLVAIDGLSHSPQQAKRIAASASQAFQSYLTSRQDEARIPQNQRVLVQTLSRPDKAVVAKGRRLTVPIVVFLSVLIATLGLAFILENLRPRATAPARELEPVPEPAGYPEKRTVARARGTETSRSKA